MAFTYNYAPQIEALQKQVDNYGQFRYGKENAYQKALAAVANPTPFSYNLENDDVYSAYRKQFLREGDRAVADTLAKVSAATGGRPSSYAVTAAQQAGDYYNSQLTDIIPTLYQNAYQRYLNGINQQKEALNVLMADREAAKNEHLTNYELLLAQLENLQALQEEQQSAQVGPSLTGTFVAPGVMEDTNTGVTYSPSGTFTTMSATPHTLSTVNNSSSLPDMEKATKSFRERMAKETEHWDAVMRHMHGSEKTYIAKQIEQSSLSDEEKAYLISLYGITESDLFYKN